MVWFRTHLGIRPFFVRILRVSESEWEMGIFGPPEKSGRFLSDGILLNALEWLVHWTDLINWSCRVPINDEDTLWNINNRSSLNIKLIESNILIYIITISQVQNSEKPKVFYITSVNMNWVRGWEWNEWVCQNLLVIYYILEVWDITSPSEFSSHISPDAVKLLFRLRQSIFD